MAASKLTHHGHQVRRRRSCAGCGKRFTTREAFECRFPDVAKSDSRREPFDEAKLRNSMMLAIGRKQMAPGGVERAVEQVKTTLLENARLADVSSHQLGQWVGIALRGIDHTAYLHFISMRKLGRKVGRFPTTARPTSNELSQDPHSRCGDMQVKIRAEKD